LTPQENKALGINRPYLTDLLNECPYKVIYNNIPYQNEKNLDISTCGRHVCWRELNLARGLDLSDYYQMMKEMKKDSGETYDQLVTRLIDTK
jgi:hypothetical protein